MPDWDRFPSQSGNPANHTDSVARLGQISLPIRQPCKPHRQRCQIGTDFPPSQATLQTTQTALPDWDRFPSGNPAYREQDCTLDCFGRENEDDNILRTSYRESNHRLPPLNLPPRPEGGTTPQRRTLPAPTRFPAAVSFCVSLFLLYQLSGHTRAEETLNMLNILLIKQSCDLVWSQA